MMVVKDTQIKTKLMFKFPQKATITIGARVYLLKRNFASDTRQKQKEETERERVTKALFLFLEHH